MKKIIGGSLAIIFGLFCFSAFFSAFFNLMAVVISLMLLVAGCLTIYLRSAGKHVDDDEGTAYSNKTDTPETPSSPGRPLPIKANSTEEMETKNIETKEIETKELETEKIETEELETEAVEIKNLEVESVEAEPVEAEPVETEPVETEPVEVEPVEVEPVEVEPAETEAEKSESEENIIDSPSDDISRLLGNTDSLVFHHPDCKFAKSKKCTAVFKTREEAIKETYKPCGICKP